METIGFLELNSIAQGIQAADTMLKAAEVNLVFARTACPGKYHVMLSGDVAAVQAAIEAGQSAGGVDSVVIPRVHPQVIQAINQATEPGEVNAVGVLEFFSVTAAVQAADVAVKAADVELVDLRLGLGIGGKSFVVLTGEVAAVREAIHAGAGIASDSGMLMGNVVIPSPRPEVFQSLY